MEYTTLGRTGLRVSVAALGCGGGSRLGLTRGKSRKEAADIVRGAIDLGVNLIDTARFYGTEDVVGDAIRGRNRASLIISTKQLVSDLDADGSVFSPQTITARLDESLKLLGVDYIDILYIQGLTLQRLGRPIYEYAINEILPVLLREKAKGKIRFIGATAAPT